MMTDFVRRTMTRKPRMWLGTARKRIAKPSTFYMAGCISMTMVTSCKRNVGKGLAAYH